MAGHVEAFRVLGGVPNRHIRYDGGGRSQLSKIGC